MRAADARSLRMLWIATLVAISFVVTAWFTCVVPFAALGVAAAVTSPRRQALACTVAVWLANQAAGFVVLTYPWTSSTLGWGIAIGAATMAGTVTAQWLLRRLPGVRSPAPILAAFAAAFVAYESLLYVVAALLLGGTAAFAPSIVAQVLALNAATLAALWGLGWLLSLRSPAYRRRVGPPHLLRNL